MKKRMLLMLFSVLAFVLLIGTIKFFQIRKAIAMGAKFAPGPISVTTYIAKKENWQPVLNAIGSLKAVNGVVVSTDLPGIISSIGFESGASVHKDDLLVQLDTRQETAQLKSAEARFEFARLNLTRQEELVAKKAVAQSEYDNAKSGYRQAEAAVEEARALIGRKTIRAPFDGLLGIRQVDMGQYLSVGNPIVSLQSLDPIYINFSLPQGSLSQLSIGKKLRLKAAGVDGEVFEGEITAIDSRLDEATRNIPVQGTVANPRGLLRPGMFVNVEILSGQFEPNVVVPATAISYAPYGDSVFVVKDGKDAKGDPQKIVMQQIVRLGSKRGDKVAVLGGLQEGDEVVSSGVFKLRSGGPVHVNNTVQPSADENPTPPNS